MLCVEFASGETNVIMVPKPSETKTNADRKPRKKARPNAESKPVNAIFIRNHGQTTVTLSHCHYISDLNGVGFRFEPQSAASPRGDHLPKRLEPGEDVLRCCPGVTATTLGRPPHRARGGHAAGSPMTMGTSAPWSSSPSSELRITRVFPCVARGFKARALASCSQVAGGSGASRGHACNAQARSRPAVVLVRRPLPHRTDCCRSIRWRDGVKGGFACTLTRQFHLCSLSCDHSRP